MKLIYDMLKIKFKIEECEDNIYDDGSESEEGREKEKESAGESVPVILSCVGWNTKNMARAVLQ